MTGKKSEKDEITMNEYDESEIESEIEMPEVVRAICREEIAKIEYKHLWEAIWNNEGAVETAQEMAHEAYTLAETADGHAFRGIDNVEELDDAIVSISTSLEADIDILNKRVKSLEALINARHAPDTAGHPNDGGWFE